MLVLTTRTTVYFLQKFTSFDNLNGWKKISPAAFYATFVSEIIITLHVLVLVWQTTVGFADGDDSFEHTSRRNSQRNRTAMETLIEVDGDALPKKDTEVDTIMRRVTTK